MTTVNYNHGSVRARKARLSRKLGKNTTLAENAVLGIVAAASLFLLGSRQEIGWSLVGAEGLFAMLVLWRRWDLLELTPDNRSLNTESIQLDAVLESRLLAQLKPNMSAADVWLAAANQWEGTFVLQRLLIPYDVVADTLNAQQVEAVSVWMAAAETAKKQKSTGIDSGIVIIATLLNVPALKPILEHLKVKNADLNSVLAWQQRVKKAMADLKHQPYFGGIGRDWASGYTPLLNQFANNLTREVEYGYYRHIPQVHENIINQTAQLLVENRPVALVGQVGIGKTSIVYSLAEKIIQAQGPNELQYYQIMSLNASVLLSIDGRIEDVVMRLLAEAVQAKNTILFLDEAQLFFNSGPGAVDLSQILLPILQHNSLKIIFAMTDHDWQALVNHQPALSGSLQRVVIPEPNVTETTAILQDAAIGVEHKSHAVVTQQSVNEAIRLAERYMPETAFPGKAITVLDSASQYHEDTFITAASVQKAVEATTGAKVTGTTAPERQQLLTLEDQIHQRMINQTRAVKVVSDALRRSRAGVGSTKRPVGSFLFLGPTGVGKTELAKSVAAVYFGGEDQIVRLDMSEYQQQSDVARLLAPSSSAQAGGTLVSQVRQRPSTVVLLDEIEKAHSDILNLLLQMLDEGRLTDANGRQVSFKDAIIVATSNAAADEIRARIDKGEELEQFEQQIQEKLISDKLFKPELLNRFDEIVVFRPLKKEELRKVVDLMLAEVNATLKSQNVAVTVTQAAADWLVEHGYDPKLGARPLRRLVQRTVENIVAERLLSGAVSAGQTLALDAPDLDSAATK